MREPARPAISMASWLWQAATPEPQLCTIEAGLPPASSAENSSRSALADLKRPPSARLRPQKRLREPGMRPATGSIGSTSPRKRGAGGAASTPPPAPPLGRARVEHDDLTADELRLQRAGVDVQVRLRPQRVIALREARHGVRQRPPFGAPGGDAAVEHRHRPVANPAQHPPQTRSRCAAGCVVGDDLIAGAQSARAEPGGKGLGCGQRVAAVAPVGCCGQVSIHVRVQRARDVRLGVLRRAELGLGELVAAIEDAPVGILQMLREDLGRDERGVGHRVRSNGLRRRAGARLADGG
jgi:hypothetical protein